MGRPLFYWIKCGNCGRIYSHENLEETIGLFVDHLNNSHRHFHGPQAGIVNANLP